MQIDVQESSGNVVVAVVGEIDAHTCGDLAAALERVIESGAQAVTLDVAGVEFIDSSGLRVLIQANERLEPGRLGLRAPNETFRRLLEITGLHDVFPTE
ncbi:MAG TPA: STAS domain-containing protein [Acidimicrobiia bacterium]|nr:STAS domain-containing protein [Acidimicrobiia bacterium]